MSEQEKPDPPAAVALRENPAKALQIFGSIGDFETAQRIAKALATSDLVPTTYKGNIGNCLIAMEAAQRTGASILAVTQNLHIIEGRPSWSSAFIIASLNSCGRFSPIRFEMKDLGRREISYDKWTGPKGERRKEVVKVTIQDRSCTAYAYDAATRERLEGPPVTMEMVYREGWYDRGGSKWLTMPDLMLRYRAAAFFGRVYASDLLMGMHSEEEAADISGAPPVRDVSPKRPAMAAPEPEAPPPGVDASTGEIQETAAAPEAKKRGRPRKSEAQPPPPPVPGVPEATETAAPEEAPPAEEPQAEAPPMTKPVSGELF